MSPLRRVLTPEDCFFLSAQGLITPGFENPKNHPTIHRASRSWRPRPDPRFLTKRMKKRMRISRMKLTTTPWRRPRLSQRKSEPPPPPSLNLLQVARWCSTAPPQLQSSESTTSSLSGIKSSETRGALQSPHAVICALGERSCK